MTSDYIIFDVHAHVQTQTLSQLNVSMIMEVFDKKYRQTLPAGQTLDDIFGETSQYDSLRAVRKQVIYRRQFLWFCFRSSNGCVCVCCYCAIFFYSQKSLEFFRAKGFDSLPQVLVNGAQVDMEEVWPGVCVRRGWVGGGDGGGISAAVLYFVLI